jgi:hypothetical protein
MIRHAEQAEGRASNKKVGLLGFLTNPAAIEIVKKRAKNEIPSNSGCSWPVRIPRQVPFCSQKKQRSAIASPAE